MTLINDFNEFQKMEDDLNLFEAKINGVLFWERIRFHVYTAIGTRSLGTANAQSRSKSRFSRLKRLLSSVFSLSRNPLLAPKSRILFVCCSRRVLENDGLWWDIYTDPIIQDFNTPPVSLEAHYNNKHYAPTKTPGLRYLDIIELFTYVKRKIGITKTSFDKNDVRLLSRIRDEIRTRFGIDLDMESQTRRILDDRNAKLPLYRRMLKRIRPEVVVLAQGYQWEDLIEVCKSLGIETVELQHGVIYPFHAAYSYEGDSRKKENFANYVLIWGDYWKSDVEYPISKNNVVSVGFPYLESKKDSYPKVAKKRQILFISQGNIGETLSRFAVALSEEPNLDYGISYKLHPQEQIRWREKYPWLASSAVEVVDSKKITLHELFAESMIQVGVCSTALFEGLVYGLQTYVVEAACVELMDSLIEQGVVEKVSTPEELLKCIREHDESKPLDVELFFRKEAVENIMSFLDNLCQHSDDVF